MKRDEIHSKAQSIVAAILRCETEDLHEATTAKDIDSWDSLSHINIIVSLEKAFDIKFALGEIQNLASFGEICQLISEKMK